MTGLDVVGGVCGPVVDARPSEPGTSLLLVLSSIPSVAPRA